MRVVLLTVGSRGDAEPFCSLASSFAAKKQHHVDLFLQTDLLPLAPSTSPESIHCHALPFTQMDFYKYVGNPTHGKDHSNPRVEFVGVVADIIAELTLPCTQDILETLDVETNKPTTVILASSLARPLAMAIGEALGGQVRPIIGWIQLQPLIPTRDFPHFSQTESCVQAVLKLSSSSSSATHTNDDSQQEQHNNHNIESYLELEQYQHEFLQDRLDPLYKSIGGSESSPPSFVKDIQPALLGQHDKIYMVNTISNQLIPYSSDHHTTSNIFHVGPLADSYIPSDWSPPKELVSFLDASCGEGEEKPICVGYGSMPFEKVTLIVEALKTMNRRAVLVGRVMTQEAGNDDNVFCIESVPYAWLLPKCCIMLSHGGAGVVHATLRAGIPSVISPLLGDQFFYAALLQAKGLGVQCGTKNLLSDATVADVVTSINKAMTCQEACRDVGIAIRANEKEVGGSGADRLVKILEEKVGVLNH